MKQVLIHGGQVVVADIPAPQIEAGHLLVGVAYSLISSGTEISSVEASSGSLLAQARKQPEKAVKLINHMQQHGIQGIVEKIKDKLDEFKPLGYSCSGRVLQVGSGVENISPGDWVACAGAGLANHAEQVLVPRNLVVRIPEGCELKAASSVTLGSIALQGVRRARPELGDIIAVIGLGLLGQITIQLLKAAGCRVIGIDLDPRRIDLAKELAADQVHNSSLVDLPSEISRATAGMGVDATIITAASSSDTIVQQAMEITRKKGKVVIVGTVGLGLKRSPFYEKEIDFLISCSYGPGRYDPTYETEGIDYPYPYVRWTENRNMAEFLRLLASRIVRMEKILEQEFPIEDAEQAYQTLASSFPKPLAIVLRYPLAMSANRSEQTRSTKVNLRPPRSSSDFIGVALVGAGNFARSIHLPNLKKLSNIFKIQAIVDKSGVIAKSTAEHFDAEIASTRFEDILDRDEISLIMICTRHDQHATLALQALQAGKHVFVEKPLALTEAELTRLEAFYNDPGIKPILQTGFNRRFSPIIKRCMEITSRRDNPMIVNYRMNAGYIPLDHWVHGKEGGGRNLGEACHIYDLFTALTNSTIEGVEAIPIKPEENYYSQRDNFTTIMRFSDGSVATLTYTALGSVEHPKEQMEIFAGGNVITMDDYKKLVAVGNRRITFQEKIADKGHLNELEALAESIKSGSDWPIPLWQQLQAMRIALEVDKSLGD